MWLSVKNVVTFTKPARRTMFDTPANIEVFRAITVKHALLFYDKTGRKVNTAYSPKSMLLATEQITGKKFKRGQYKEAAAALDEFIKNK